MLDSMLSPHTLKSAAAKRAEFLGGRPFKHVVIDDFFAPELAEGLLRDFPSFSNERAKNEFGEVGGKATFEEVRKLSDHYRRVDELISGAEFRGFISTLTGIPELLYDPTYFGGGTHENRHGQELDPHVDFNFDQRTGNHRRLNLIVYLNREWEEAWGGSIEVHSNPRDWKTNQVRSFAPIFNRCILFETNEISWHGFPKIELPEDKRHLSRKSFTVYYYSKERPAEEVAPSHGTFYVQRPLPADLVAGSVLTPDKLEELRRLLQKRDSFIRHYQKQELAHSAQVAAIARELDEVRRNIRVPVAGWAVPEGVAEGYWHDGWVGRKLTADFRALRRTARVTVDGWRPDFLGPTPIELMVGAERVRKKLDSGVFQLTAPFDLRPDQLFRLQLETAEAMSGKQRGVNQDEREVAFVLRRITFD